MVVRIAKIYVSCAVHRYSFRKIKKCGGCRSVVTRVTRHAAARDRGDHPCSVDHPDLVAVTNIEVALRVHGDRPRGAKERIGRRSAIP